MSQELDPLASKKTEKILVCITVQSSSRRLIKKAYEITRLSGGDLHILHVQKGSNIFLHPDTTQLLQELFQYGSELGGVVHMICDDQVPERIARFISEMDITQVVLGETMRSKLQRLVVEDIQGTIESAIPEVEVMILQREKSLHIKDKQVFSS